MMQPEPFSQFDIQPGDDPGYCTTCGRLMELVVVHHGTYDAGTGRRMVHWHRKCPRQPRSSFAFVFLRGGVNHTELCGPTKVVFA